MPSNNNLPIPFTERHPILARGWKDTWQLWKGQLIVSGVLSFLGIPLAVRLGLLTETLSLASVLFFFVLYGAALLITLLWKFFRAPYALYKQECVQLKGVRRQLESEQAQIKLLQGEILKIQEQPKPDIRIKILEVFIEPFEESAHCFLSVRLTNHADIPCGNPHEYSLALSISGVEYSTLFLESAFLDLRKYYLSRFDWVTITEEIAYDESGKKFIDSFSDEKETYQEDLVDIRTKTEELKKGIPVLGWLGFSVKWLPQWPIIEKEIGGHFEWSENSTMVNLVRDTKPIRLTDTVETVALTALDIYENPYSTEKSRPFNKYGARIVLRTL